MQSTSNVSNLSQISRNTTTNELNSDQPDNNNNNAEFINENVKNSSKMQKKIEFLLSEWNPSLSVEIIEASAAITLLRLENMKKNEPSTISENENFKKSRDVAHEVKKKMMERKFPKEFNKRRQCLPTKPKNASGLWTAVKSSIGKDLANMPIPLVYFEPTSMLQRIAEDFEYSYLLDRAAACTDPLQQLALISSFVITAYSSTANRLTQPFNPLLGETYELDRRDDMGWRLMSEQVLITPPTSVHYCESKSWKCWKTFSARTIFRGTYLKMIPSGTCHLSFDSGNIYSWGRIESTVNNIIIGNMWLDNAGELTVINHTDGSKCIIKFIPFDYFNKHQQKRIKGEVIDAEDNIKWTLDGKWDSFIEMTPVKLIDGELKPMSSPINVWQSFDIPPEIAAYYNFSLFTCQLNEPDEYFAPTDTRRRMDFRCMENGLWEEAETLKKNMDKMYQADNDNQNFPVWFSLAENQMTNKPIYIFSDNYWKSKATCDWSKCPTDLFSKLY